MNLPKILRKSAPRSGSIHDRGKVRLLRFPKRDPDEPGGWQSFWRLGPGMVTGSANIDPSAVITATVAGAAFSFSLLWVVLLCIPFLLAIFAVTARIGIETGQGLLDLVRTSYGKRIAVFGAVVAIIVNMAVVVADLMAVSDSLSIILGQPRMYFVAATAFSVWYILIFRDYRKITRVLVLLSLPLYLYIAAAVITAPSLRTLLWNALIPHMRATPDYIEGVVALMGSFMTPYIVIWQVSSRSDPKHEPHASDSRLATLVTALLAVSIMVAAGSVLHFSQAVDMTPRQAAEALRPVVGDWGTVLFALGIVGSGMVALPVLVASMCYDLAQASGWKYGLSEEPWQATRFYALISVAMLLAGVANFLHVNPTQALYWSMILAGILLVPTLGFILIISNDRRVMHTPNTRWQNFWVGAAAGASVSATLAYFWAKVLR